MSQATNPTGTILNLDPIFPLAQRSMIKKYNNSFFAGAAGTRDSYTYCWVPTDPMDNVFKSDYIENITGFNVTYGSYAG